MSKPKKAKAKPVKARREKPLELNWNLICTAIVFTGRACRTKTLKNRYRAILKKIGDFGGRAYRLGTAAHPGRSKNG